MAVIDEDLERAPDDLPVLEEVVNRVELAVRTLGEGPQFIRDDVASAPLGGVQQVLDPA